jgi:hypothetical protein
MKVYITTESKHLPFGANATEMGSQRISSIRKAIQVETRATAEHLSRGSCLAALNALECLGYGTHPAFRGFWTMPPAGMSTDEWQAKSAW